MPRSRSAGRYAAGIWGVPIRAAQTELHRHGTDQETVGGCMRASGSTATSGVDSLRRPPIGRNLMVFLGWATVVWLFQLIDWHRLVLPFLGPGFAAIRAHPTIVLYAIPLTLFRVFMLCAFPLGVLLTARRDHRTQSCWLLIFLIIVVAGLLLWSLEGILSVKVDTAAIEPYSLALSTPDPERPAPTRVEFYIWLQSIILFFA